MVEDDGYEIFERYHSRSSNDPRVTIQKSGISISMNRSAYRSIGSPKRVILGCLKDKYFTIAPVDPNDSISGTRVNRQGNSETYYIAGKAFTGEFEINTQQARQYNVTIKNDKLYIYLNGVSVDATGPHSRRKKSLLSTAAEQLSFDDSSKGQEKKLQTGSIVLAQRKSESEIETELEQLVKQGIPVEQILRRIQARKTKS